ncbi:MAG: HAD hydrolase family protein [Candidatus Omnitrophota bacterium]
MRKTELIVYDFDGVMTDNKVIFMEDGSEGVAVNRSDGLAVDIFKKRGISQVILSTEKNKVVTARARKLGIPALQGISDKSSSLKKYCRQNKINVKNVVYVGNDLNDLEVMKIAGCPVCPSDACRQVKAVARIILDTAGGDGVVRELLEHIK